MNRMLVVVNLKIFLIAVGNWKFVAVTGTNRKKHYYFLQRYFLQEGDVVLNSSETVAK